MRLSEAGGVGGEKQPSVDNILTFEMKMDFSKLKDDVRRRSGAAELIWRVPSQSRRGQASSESAVRASQTRLLLRDRTGMHHRNPRQEINHHEHQCY